MKISFIILLVNILAGIELASSQDGAAASTALMEGKVRTDRTVNLDAIVDAPPAEVYRLWTSADGVRKFFAPEAKIDARIGGRYQIIFFPSKDPEGESHGTKGARILDLVPNKKLTFEWITFAGDGLLGKNAPPYAPPAERNVTPLPTWVELSFEPVAGQPNQTHVKFAHYGFRDGERWKQSYQWFTRAWKGVLDQLSEYCKKSNKTASAPRSIVDLYHAEKEKESL
jgi:uncharacterized protein YndB with AHSA1/START domain